MILLSPVGAAECYFFEIRTGLYCLKLELYIDSLCKKYYRAVDA
jgi:hypothetical protein